MYESNQSTSVESLISATNSASSFERFIGAPEAAPMDATVTLEPEDKEMDPPAKELTRSLFFCKPVYFETIYSVSEALLPGRGFMVSSVYDEDDSLLSNSETSPIELDITVSEMDSIMSVLHAKQMSSPLNLTIEQWSEALHIATLWNLTSAREHIIERFATLFPDQPPIDRIVIADKCGVAQWIHPAYETLCTRQDPPTLEEGIEKLGVKRIVALFTIREACRATSVPPSSQSATLFCGGCGVYGAFKRYPGRSGWVQCVACNRTQVGLLPSPVELVPKDIAISKIKDSKELSCTVAGRKGPVGLPLGDDSTGLKGDPVGNGDPLMKCTKGDTTKRGKKGKKGGGKGPSGSNGSMFESNKKAAGVDSSV
ncbi:hypothetical protein FRB96_002606 [Tulasnella sp. 330]|nr:hypothetical protein FRB96_002606 [Tulasnella sp. 330]